MEALDMEAPKPRDFTMEENPYQAHYGDENWEEKIDEKALVGRVCVTKLIDWMFEETKKIVGENYWVAHDALSQMTSREGMEYMKAKGYYQHWVIPEEGLFDNRTEKRVKYWKDRPVGNNPNYMPLDNSLNNDLHKSVTSHCIMTQILDNNDTKKFSMRTPKQGLSAYERIWAHHPPSKRIIQDINLTYDSLKDILKTKGAMRSGTVSGSRKQDRGKHGGARKKLTEAERKEKDGRAFIHEDAKPCLKLYAEEAKKKRIS